MTKKVCYKCNSEKNTSDFTKDKSRADGLHIMCKQCKRERDKHHHDTTYREKRLNLYKQRRLVIDDVITEAKKSGCVCCGETFAGCLEFHHTDPTIKEFQIAGGRNRNPETVKQEISKCIVVCSNCHKKIHAGVLTT